MENLREIFQERAGIPFKRIINENQDLETFERMEGLAHMDNLKRLQDLLRLLTTDWVDEGFDKTDVKNYIVNYIEQI